MLPNNKSFYCSTSYFEAIIRSFSCLSSTVYFVADQKITEKLRAILCKTLLLFFLFTIIKLFSHSGFQGTNQLSAECNYSKKKKRGNNIDMIEIHTAAHTHRVNCDIAISCYQWNRVLGYRTIECYCYSGMIGNSKKKKKKKRNRFDLTSTMSHAHHHYSDKSQWLTV